MAIGTGWYKINTLTLVLSVRACVCVCVTDVTSTKEPGLHENTREDCDLIVYDAST